MPKLDLPQGTLDLLILRVLSSGELHGWGIAQRLAIVSEDALRLEEGTLYPALYRMEAKGWIDGTWAQSENNRRAKYYKLTRAGRKQLAVEEHGWERLSAVVKRILQNA
jgi:PadR family transcriptional regulator, regulatory protein PadR